MVLHHNKWDRKATRAHVRKQLGAKVKEDDTKKQPRTGTKEEGGAGVEKKKKEYPTLSSGTGGDNENEDDSEEGEGREEEGEGGEEDESGSEHGGGGGGGQFSRRKMQNNAWRYEQEEEELAPGEEPEEPEPEPDYVAMTRERKGQLEKPEEALKQDLDEEFLKDLHALGGRRGDARGGGFDGGKGKVVRVDRKQFEDVTTKMAKQSTADAFRQRFAPRKAKSRGASEGTGGVEDVDSFLGELKLDEIAASYAAGRETSGKLGGSRTSEGYGHDKDDDWLDSMLGGR
ncbi:hypothetical protein Q9L58_009394 [Maublancomyces gigas]|uniref:Uncharacterized protein n=1 Tax=Discina gigas TaxID=1032678 RepID=A0ABR3G7F3_9PEZI